MRRAATLILLMAGTMLVASTPVASAKKPPRPPDEPVAGTTCEQIKQDPHMSRLFDYATEEWNDDYTAFTVELELGQHACVDVPFEADSPLPWFVEVDIGSARSPSVSLAVGDSVSPGDTCWGGCNGDPEATVTEDASFWTTPIDGSGLDACGDSFGDTDPRLVFTASYDGRGRAGTQTTIRVTLP